MDNLKIKHCYHLSCEHKFYSHTKIRLGAEVLCRTCAYESRFVEHLIAYRITCKRSPCAMRGRICNSEADALNFAHRHVRRCTGHIVEVRGPLGNTIAIVAAEATRLAS